MVRANCATQQCEWRPDSALGPYVSAASWFETPYSERYDAVEQLRENSTPFMSVAFPVSVFRDLRLRFDESLTTTEDWQFIGRAAQYCGVADDFAVTAIYRRWQNAVNSESLHDLAEWLANRDRIIQGMNGAPLLLPPRSARRIVDLIEGNAAAEAVLEAAEAARVAAEAARVAAEARANECQFVLRAMMRRFRFVKFLWPKKCFAWYRKRKKAFGLAATG